MNLLIIYYYQEYISFNFYPNVQETQVNKIIDDLELNEDLKDVCTTAVFYSSKKLEELLLMCGILN